MKKYIFTILLLFEFFVFFGQTKTDEPLYQYTNYDEIIPPSPDAESLGTFGNNEINLFSGAVNITIPIYTYKTKNLSVPIVLSYSSNGVKVGETASLVGIDWSMTAGGVINRTVLDKPDELTSNRRFELDFHILTPTLIDYLENVTTTPNEIDNQPDVFSFSYLGRSGKFVYDENGFIYTIPYSNIIIDYNKDNTGFTGGISGFIITDKSGIKYFFTAPETTQIVEGSSCKVYDKQIVNSAWYLTQIIHPKGDVIYLEYDFANYIFQTRDKHTVTRNLDYYSCNADTYCDLNNSSVFCKQYQRYFTPVLKKIYSNQIDSVKFIHSQDRDDLKGASMLNEIVIKNNNEVIKRFVFNYDFIESNKARKDILQTYNYRMFLKSIQEFSADTIKSVPPYEFFYFQPENLPDRLSYDIDHWGFYNAANNSLLAPSVNNYRFQDYIGADREPTQNLSVAKYGILEKVVYPTKGYSIFEYEHNNYLTEDIVGYGEHNVINEYYKINYAENTWIDFEFTISQTQNIDFYLTCGEVNENKNIKWGKVIFELVDNNAITFFNYELEAQNEAQNSAYENIDLEPGTYNLRVMFTAGVSELFAQFYFNYFDSLTIQNVNKNTGGLRVSKIKNYDINNHEPQIISYYYNTFDNKEFSSGITTFEPNYFSYYTIEKCCNMPNGSMPFRCSYGQSNSSPVNSVFFGNGTHIVYPFVTIGYGDNFENGGEEFEFSFYNDEGALYECCDQDINIPNSPNTDYSWKSGKIKNKRTFRLDKNTGNDITLKDENYFYHYDDSVFHEIKGLTIRRQVPTTCYQHQEDFYCPDNVEDLYFIWGPENQDHFDCLPIVIRPKNPLFLYLILSGRFPVIYLCTDEPYFAFPEKKYGYCTPNNLGAHKTYSSDYKNYDVESYKHVSQWTYLEKEIVTEYDNNGQNPYTKTVLYKYDNPLHLQMTSSETYTSDGKQVLNEYFYPQDFILENIYDCNLDYFKTTKQYLIELSVCLKSCIDANCDYDECCYNCYDVYNQDMQNAAEEFEVCLNPDNSDFNKSLAFMNINGISNPIIAEVQKINGNVTNSSINFTGLYKNNFNDYFIDLKNIYHFDTKNTFEYPFFNSNGEFVWDENKYYKSIEFDRFDDFGNLIQYHNENDIPVCIIYGYNYNYPIAKIENADFNEVINSIAFTYEQLQNKDDNELLNIFDNLRTNNPQWIITSYTYEPMVGIKTISDPNGYTTEYIYDELKRLKTIIDEDGNVLKQIEYNYKTNNN